MVATTEYVAASYLDMAWHTIKDPVNDANKSEDSVLDRIGLNNFKLKQDTEVHISGIYLFVGYNRLLQLFMD